MANKLKYPLTSEFESAFERFYEKCRHLIETENAKYAVEECRCSLDYDMGKRYIKVIRVDNGGTAKSSYCFVDKASGDILKAASWAAPAKGARGNIFSADFGASAVTPYGAVYLKGGKH